MTVRAAATGRAPLAAGVDIGGSKVLAVAVDGARAERGRVRLPTGSGAAGVVESAVEAVSRLAEHVGVAVSDFAVVGVGVPGLVQRDSGDVSHAVNLGVGGAGLSLGAELESRLGVPVAVENDVNAAALGAAAVLDLPEADLAYLSIGTGLAAGLVLGGRVRHGARGAAGEIGHVPVDLSGPLCACGQRGCLETLASGSAIAARWQAPPLDPSSPAASLFAAAASGDPRAVAIRDEVAGHIASAVRLLVLTCDVETVVLGGGVAEVGPDLLDAVRAALQRQAAASAFVAALDLPDRVALVPADSAVGAVGAAMCGVLALDAGDAVLGGALGGGLDVGGADDEAPAAP
jgi:glucokinase